MKFLPLILILFVFCSLTSCNKFKGDQEIPSYIRFEPWSLTTDYETEGAATEAITDAWLYVDGNFVGCYEFLDHEDGKYALAPVLHEGTHDITLAPGIKMNGISSTRIHYPFYHPLNIESYSFKPGVIDTIFPYTRYYHPDSSSVKFKMIEDFEDINNIRLFKTSQSDTTVVQTSTSDPNTWLDPVSPEKYCHSGHVWIGDTLNYFCVASDALYDLPNMGNYIILELDYKCEAEFEVGLFAKTKNGIEDIELVMVRKSDDWKKIYINFSPSVTETTTADYFKFYLRGSVKENEEANYYFDNIKLIYRD